ncbi:1762_t:CDS:2 [Ambispora gerdemannii]|uniref:1762_t:CDS:1 n=1 Tax=Ambispora gerdemannii TaxID=144530 RepID=A0A9N8V1Y4_9GLOM|nr:1762_t:CDS:2 [Ambispora gerdemannii]
MRDETDETRGNAWDVLSKTLHTEFCGTCFLILSISLASALYSIYDQEIKMFDNVNGFIAQMKTTWEMINARGSFLHFNNFKEIEKWNAMQTIVQNLQRILNHSGTKIEKLHRDESLFELNQQAANQLDSKVKRILSATCSLPTNSISKQMVRREMEMHFIEDTGQLEQTVNSFNETIKGGQSTVNSQNPDFQQKILYVAYKMPATLATEGIVVNYDVIIIKKVEKITNAICTEIKMDKINLCESNMARRIIGFRGYAMDSTNFCHRLRISIQSRDLHSNEAILVVCSEEVFGKISQLTDKQVE